MVVVRVTPIALRAAERKILEMVSKIMKTSRRIENTLFFWHQRAFYKNLNNFSREGDIILDQASDFDVREVFGANPAVTI